MSDCAGLTGSGFAPLIACTLVIMLLATDAVYSARPQPPALDRDIHLVEGNEFLDPYIPALRTSNDGRIALEVEKGTLDFYLFTPEKVNAPFFQSSPGTGSILANQSPYRVTHHPYDNAYYGHQTLCETTGAFPSSGGDTNPYLCGANDNNDCYDLTHVGWVYTGTDARIRLWGTPLTVEVSNPKTPQASIVDVRVGSSVSGPEMAGSTFWEIATTSDGRLISGRMDNRELTFVNARTGQSHTGNYQMIYSLLEDGADACDVREWKRFFPIAHAPYDPRVKEDYGFAAFPFRTGDGEFVSETTNFGGTYPWLDREGNNLFMTTFDEQLTDQASAYPNRCVPGTSCMVQDNRDGLKGDAMAGLWTQGKQIHFDNMMNNTDWGLPLNPDGHRLVTMYDNPDGSSSEVRVGTGGRTKHQDYPNLPGRTNNTAIMDSVQSIFNHDPEMFPRTPRDVVWHMSNGKATDELVFDDYLHPDGFIVSSMMAALTTHYPIYNNGFSRNSGFSEDVLMQNAATAMPDRWRIPAYGVVERGTGRVEPIALGGLHGRGFWLDGGNAIRYNVPDQPRDPADSDWYVGLFVDSRFGDDGQRRNLIRYPDGSTLSLEGRSQLLFVVNGSVVERVALPQNLPDTGWAHIGLNLSDRNRNIELLHNGYAFGNIRIDDGFFNITSGDLIVGGNNGFMGWIDDFKVFAQRSNPEVACNHAAGTLIGIDGNSSWNDVAGRYPQASHAAINGLVSASGRETYSRYACYTNYRDALGIDVRNPPANTVGIREAINFPEGPIVYNESRPDSVSNEFCLSCHHVDGPAGLGLDALRLDTSLTATDDPRRQPTQHLRVVHGNIPAGWLEGRVSDAIKAGPEGFLLDPVLLTQERPEQPDDDVVVGFSEGSMQFGEEVGSVQVTVALSDASSSESSVYFSTNGDSANPGADFYGHFERLTFAAGETEKQVSILIIDDAVEENTEQFTARLFDATGAELGQRTINLNVTDNDDGSVPIVSVSSIAVSEADQTAAIPVSLSTAASTTVTVEVATQPDGAVNKEDYYGLYQTVTFAPGETSKLVNVAILNDQQQEPDEQFTVSLFNADGAALGTRKATVTINNDD